MKLRLPFHPQQLLFATGCALLLTCGAMAQAPAAAGTPATFKVKGSTTGMQQGVVLGVGTSGVQIQIGTQVIALPPAMFESFQMAPPPEYLQGFQAFTARDYPKALVAIKSVVDKYKGLPADWVQYAAGMLGDIYVAQNDLPRAEAAYNDFRKLYPAAASATTDVGLARIAVAKKDLDTAKAKLDPITTEALQQKAIPAAKALAYSQAFVVSGTIKEAEGNLPGALEDYLRTVTVFYHDPAAVSVAQEKADALRAQSKDHPVFVP